MNLLEKKKTKKKQKQKIFFLFSLSLFFTEKVEFTDWWWITAEQPRCGRCGENDRMKSAPHDAVHETSHEGRKTTTTT